MKLLKNLRQKWKTFFYEMVIRGVTTRADKISPGSGYILAMRAAFSGPSQEIFYRFGYSKWIDWLLQSDDIDPEIQILADEHSEKMAEKARQERVEFMARDNERDIRREFPELAKQMGL